VPNLLLQQRGRDTMSVEQQNRSGRVRAGIDWASTDHAVAVVDDDGLQIDRFTVEHRAGDLHRLTTRLRRAGVSEVAIERPDGPVVDALLEAGLTVFVIAPNQVKNLRSRYGSAGNKDDRFDAFVLADTLRTDRTRLRPLTLDSDATVTLRMTVRARKDLINARIAMANQLRAHLQITLPGAIGLFRDIDSAITLQFLTRFPSQDKADWLSELRLANWLRSVSYNHLANLDRLWGHLHDAPRGTTGEQARARARSPWRSSPP
jgi:transposase